MSRLFEPFKLKSLEVKNRIVMAPMCQYCAKDGMPDEWHYIHYTSRAIGGTGLVMIEMTNVEPDGRSTDECLGIWSDEHIPQFARIVQSCHSYGAKVGIQIAHAGRKAKDAEVSVSSSPYPFSERYKTPRELSTKEVKDMVLKFEQGFKRAVAAGVDIIEIHGAHGYLIHQFHSPFINKRDDEYGRDLSKFGVEIIQAAKRIVPDGYPISMRISAREYSEGGYGIEHMLEICAKYKEAGVDIFHVSSGGEGPLLTEGVVQTPGYQVPFAEMIRKELNVPVIAVGVLEDPDLAQSTLEKEQADMIAVGRGMLRSPYWASEASARISEHESVPKQYSRAF